MHTKVEFDTTLLQLAVFYLGKKGKITNGQFDVEDFLDVCDLILKKVDLINRGSVQKRISFEHGKVVCSKKLLDRKVK